MSTISLQIDWFASNCLPRYYLNDLIYVPSCLSYELVSGRREKICETAVSSLTCLTDRDVGNQEFLKKTLSRIIDLFFHINYCGNMY